MDSVKETIQKNWNQNAESYDSQYLHGLKSGEEKEAWLSLLKELVPEKDQRILDVGTGTGFLALLLAEQGHICKGVDLSPGMLGEAKEKAKAMKLNIDFELGDAEKLEEKSGVYDVVINRHILWTMPHPKQAVGEWVRVLKPGGRLIVIDGDWFFDSPMNNLQIFLGKVLTLLTKRENLFRKSGSGLHEHLPMTKAENAKKAPQLLEEAGLFVQVRQAPAVTEAERRGMPLVERLLNPHKRIIIIGKKPEHSQEERT